MAIETINIRVYTNSGAIDSTLSPSISIYDNSDNSIDFSWVMSFNATLWIYQFFPNIDSTKTYTCNVDFWVIALTRYTSFGISASSSWGWASVADIWNAQIGDYSSTAGTFGNKFSTYGGVSHVIDRSQLDDYSKSQLLGFKDKMEEFSKTLKEFKSNEKDFSSIVDMIKNNPSKTTVIKQGSQYEETIWELLAESIPQLMEKLDEATQMIPLYEELINYMDTREKDWEKLVEDIINNN